MFTINTEPGEKDGKTVHVKCRRQAIRWLREQQSVSLSLSDRDTDLSGFGVSPSSSL